MTERLGEQPRVAENVSTPGPPPMGIYDADHPWYRVPNPGSPEARAAGCRCPTTDNDDGRLVGGMGFYLLIGCPLHANKARPSMASWLIAKHPELGENSRGLVGKGANAYQIADYVIALLWSGVGAARYVAICAYYQMDSLEGLELLAASGAWTDMVRSQIQQASREVEGIVGDAALMRGGDQEDTTRILHMLWLAFFGDRNEIKSATAETKRDMIALINRMQDGLVHLHPLARADLADFLNELAA